MKKSFINSIPAIFQSEKERERLAIEEIENARRDRERREQIARQAGMLRDKVTEARLKTAAIGEQIDHVANFSFEDIYRNFIQGITPIDKLAELLAEREAVAKHATAVKKMAHVHFVVTAERESADFERANAAALRGVQLTPADEPAFTAANLAKDHYENGEFQNLTKKMAVTVN